MSHQDRTPKIVVNHETLKQAVDWLLPKKAFATMKARSNALWKPRLLAVTALLWATGSAETLGERFAQACKVVNKVFRWQPPVGTSYQGFMKMLRKWHLHLLLAIVPDVRVKMREVLPGQWMIAGFVVIAGDGSRIELPRTASLEAAFSPQRKKNKNKKGKKHKQKTRTRSAASRRCAATQTAESIAKKANSPQMWLTLLWHVGSGLPWAWKTGPSDSSERGHLEQMLLELPENSLITADAGFVGYDFWNKVLHAGHSFVIRVGGNVRLLKQLGCAREYAHTVYLWPDAAAKKTQPPLVLRLIVIHDGKQPMYLVTNLTKTPLSDRQAAQIYAARWGIELFFRTFKQTFGCRKLRSHTAENADLELDWSLLGLWCISLLAQRELVERGEAPRQCSAAKAIKAFQKMLNEYRVRPESQAETLWEQLGHALLDDYQRTSSKTSRNFPRKKKRQAIVPPIVALATPQQIEAAQQLPPNQLEFQLPA